MLNKLMAMGRLTETPELKTTQGGTSVTSFTLAVPRNYSSSGERQTDFIRCVAWRNTAEFISKYFTKGKLMVIEAELQSRSYQNKDGVNVTVWEAIVSNAYFGGDKSESSNGYNDDGVYPNVHTEGEGFDDDLPF